MGQSLQPLEQCRGEWFTGSGSRDPAGNSPFPSCVLPQPEIMHFRPTGNFWMARGRQTGWMYLLKTRGLVSSRTATSKSRMLGLYWGCSTALLSPIFTGLPPMPVRDTVPRWARTSSTFVLLTRGHSDTPAAPKKPGRPAGRRFWGRAPGERGRTQGCSTKVVPGWGPGARQGAPLASFACL